MPRIERIISKGQLVPLHFLQDAVAASQTDAQLAIIDATGAAANDSYCMPFAGEIVAVSYVLSAAGGAGAFTIGPTIDGTEKTALQQTVGTTAEGRKTVPRGTISFAAGDQIGAEITTDGSWDGTSSDLLVTVWVLLYLEGI